MGLCMLRDCCICLIGRRCTCVACAQSEATALHKRAYAYTTIILCLIPARFPALRSLGAIMFEMVVGYPPFYSDDPLTTCRKIVNWRMCLKFPDEIQVGLAADWLGSWHG